MTYQCATMKCNHHLMSTCHNIFSIFFLLSLSVRAQHHRWISYREKCEWNKVNFEMCVENKFMRLPRISVTLFKKCTLHFSLESCHRRNFEAINLCVNSFLWILKKTWIRVKTFARIFHKFHIKNEVYWVQWSCFMLKLYVWQLFNIKMMKNIELFSFILLGERKKFHT